MRVLLVADDRETASAVGRGLEHEGHSVEVAHDVRAALGLLDLHDFDAAIVDFGLPGGTGYDVLDRIEAGRRPAAVLMLTARGAVEERVEGLDRGADDCLVKPFSFSELAARLRALHRRSSAEGSSFRVGGLEVDLVHRVATARGRRIHLTPIEFSLLACLLRAAGEPLGRAALLREVWGYDFDPGTNVVDVHVNRLRRKLAAAGVASVIRTLRGRGYAAG